MIQNIVFDMGNVLLDYDPVRFISYHTDCPADQELIRNALFRSPEWAMLDAGATTDDGALEAAKARLPERLHGTVRDVFEKWHTYYLNIPEATQLVDDLKAAGRSIYLLSNASLRWYRYQKDYPVFSRLDGYIISASVKEVKPNPGIYEALFSTYGLKPAECFFVDDLPANIEGARRMGMDGFALTHYQYPALRARLTEIGAFEKR